MKPWAHAEERTARALRGRRVKRERFESAPDIADVPGLLVEVKYRKRLPRLVVEALRQAEGYAILGQRPVAVLFERGSRVGLAVLRLSDFAELARAGALPSTTTPNTAPSGADRKESS